MKTGYIAFSLIICGLIPLTVNGADINQDRDLPNIILLVADDLGWGDPGCYGNPIIQTPNIDYLAKSGIRFTQFHSAGTVCSPSRASLLTGKSPYRLGMYFLATKDMFLKPEELTIPELLKQQHYTTFFSGKWHMSTLGEGMTPDIHGFDYYFASQTNSRSGSTSTTKDPTNLVRNGKPIEKTDGYYCDLIVDEAINWIEDPRNRKGPFFMEICFSEPHTPVTPPEAYAEPYVGPEIDSLAKTLGYGGMLRFHGKIPGYIEESNFTLKKYYYGIVEQMDAAVGRLIQSLKQSGQFENTLIIFTSDNGPEYPHMGFGLDFAANRSWGTPGQFRGVKRSVYEGGHTVPGLVCWPARIDPGQICRTPVSSVDLLSTLCKLTGVDIPHQADLDGRDISILFENPEAQVQRDVPLYWNTPYWGAPNMSMRYGDFTVVACFTLPVNPDAGTEAWAKEARLHHFEVYNIEKDLKQKNDLYPGYEEKYQYLVEHMVALWEKVQADCPVWPNINSGRIKTVRKPGFDVPNY